MACGARKFQHLNHALTIDDSRKGRHLSHEWELKNELYRSRQEAVAGKVCDCAVLQVDAPVAPAPRLKEDALEP